MLYAGNSYIIIGLNKFSKGKFIKPSSILYNIKDTINNKTFFRKMNNIINIVIHLILSNKFNIWVGQSAGNYKQGSSETIRNDIKNNIKNISIYNIPIKNIKLISEHVPKHKKFINDKDFSYYLAGLMDSSGSIINNQIVININNNDISYLYTIKKYIGYGYIIKPNKTKINNLKLIDNTIKLVIKPNKGILRILELINNKIYNINLYNDIKKYIKINNILPTNSNNLKLDLLEFKLNKNEDIFDNFWLAGYLDNNSIFNIDTSRLADCKHSNDSNNNNILIDNINFNLLIKSNNIHILKIILKNFGGYITELSVNRSDILSEDLPAVYNINSIDIVYLYIIYLNKYNLISNNYLKYLYWRKIYIKIQNIMLYNNNVNLNNYNHENECSKLYKYINKLNKLNKILYK